MRTDYIDPEAMSHVLAALTPPNALVMRVCMAYGLRVSDVLRLKTDDVFKRRFTIHELKTGKPRRIKLSDELYTALLRQGGRVWIFEGRTDWRRHRTRQAVWRDVKRAARAFRIPANVAPHSARKLYAVQAYRRVGNLSRVQRLLNHSDIEVTMIYAMADELTKRKLRNRKKIPASRQK